MTDPMWADQPMVSFDTETTGVNVEQDRIVTASIVRVTPGGKQSAAEWLVNPGIDIPKEATDVHGITTEQAQTDGVPPVDCLTVMVKALAAFVAAGEPLVVYNASYDLTLLDRECRRHGVPTLHQRLGDTPLMVIDPLVLDRKVDPYRRGTGVRKLTYLCQHVYNVPLSDEDAHGSTADALASVRVAWKIAKTYPAVGYRALHDLVHVQAVWHRQWADNFGAYLVRQGKPDDVERDWPIRALSEVSDGKP